MVKVPKSLERYRPHQGRLSRLDARLGTFLDRLSKPRNVRRINGLFTIFWAAWFVPAIVVEPLRNSVLAVAIYSIWANLVGHYNSWLAARVEVRQERSAPQLVAPEAAPEGPAPGGAGPPPGE